MYTPARRIAVCAIAYNEAPYILEWIAFYRSHGVSDIFVYDNVSTDGTSEALAALDNAGYIKRIHWPRLGDADPQRQAYRNFINEHSWQYEWVLICDLDEFIVPANGTLLGLLDEIDAAAPDAGAVAIPWLTFGPGDDLDGSPETPVTERFTSCAPNPELVGKTLFKPSRIERAAGCHLLMLHSGVYLDNSLKVADWNLNDVRLLKQTQPGRVLLHHYKTKSYKEWILRSRRPNATVVGADPRRSFERALAEYRHHAQMASAVNRDAQRFAHRVSGLVAEMEAHLASMDHQARRMKVSVRQATGASISGLVSGDVTNAKEIRVTVNNSSEYMVRPNRVMPDGSRGFCIALNGASEGRPQTVRISVVGQRRGDTYVVTDGKPVFEERAEIPAPPAVALRPAPHPDSGPTVDGTAPSAVLVTVYSGDTRLGDSFVGEDGTFSWCLTACGDSSPVRTDGVHVLRFVASNSEGDSEPSTMTFTIGPPAATGLARSPHCPTGLPRT